MREFFKLWRRKIGVVTLVMACVLGAGWVRSPMTQDDFTIPFVPSVELKVISVSQKLFIGAQRVSGENSLLATFWTSQVVHEGYCDHVVRFRDSSLVKLSSSITDGIFSTNKPQIQTGTMKIQMDLIQFPCWSIVLPLTLLSAFLLLSKPRQAKPPVQQSS